MQCNLFHYRQSSVTRLVLYRSASIKSMRTEPEVCHWCFFGWWFGPAYHHAIARHTPSFSQCSSFTFVQQKQHVGWKASRLLDRKYDWWRRVLPEKIRLNGRQLATWDRKHTDPYEPAPNAGPGDATVRDPASITGRDIHSRSSLAISSR